MDSEGVGMQEVTGGRLGLIGQHISYALSPMIHEFASTYLGYPCRYEVFDCASADLGALLRDFWEAGGVGLNVTTPHKRAVAALVGAPLPSINTLYRGAHFWEGVSTDGQGFALALQRLGVYLASCEHMVILGAGGVVSAILAVLGGLARPPAVTILRRDSQHDQELRQLLGPQAKLRFEAFTPEALQEVLPRGLDDCVLVQATSGPQHGALLEQFIPCLAGFQGAVVDLIYGKVSALLGHAQRQGLRCQDGLPMLIEQARLAEIQWWGEAAPYEAIAEKLKEHRGKT